LTDYSVLRALLCPECGHVYDAGELQTFCKDCASPLVAQYDLSALQLLSKDEVRRRPKGLWRWHELLPLKHAQSRIILGEGDSPLLQTPRLAETLGMGRLYIKDESGQPTGTFKARGLAMAVSKAIELGVEEFVIPTAGNAGSALAAYAARAGKKAHIFMPQDAPRVNQEEVRIYGADLVLVDGLIDEAGKQAREMAEKHGWFDVSTFKEPYRLEGKKTMGLELAEQFDWQLPDVIIYPTGGGTGLVGMWKAFSELGEMNWIGSKRPKMVSVQAAGCAPIVRAFANQAGRAAYWEGAETIAAGLRVPSAFADRLILNALYSSGGTAVAVTDEEILEAQTEVAALEGVFTAPEGAATYAAVKHLRDDGWLNVDDEIVLYNTGSGLKYL
jgi:threonine synthase